MHAAWSVLAWQLAVMAQGIFPATRHDRTAWPEYSENKQLSGASLGYRALAVLLKGDWQ
jgi:hypothetical protein